MIGHRIDELGRNPQPISRLTDAALQDVAHAEIPPNLLERHRLALVDKRRMPRNDEKTGNFR